MNNWHKAITNVAIVKIVSALMALALTACGVVFPQNPTAVPTRDATMNAVATEVSIYVTATAAAANDSQPCTLNEVLTAADEMTNDEFEKYVADCQTHNTGSDDTTVPISQTLLGTVTMGNWTILRYTGVTAEMEKWFFNDLAPADWPEFPNVDNDVLDVPASQGLEYGEDLNTFCQFAETCDFVVPARHYRIYSGDYALDGVGSCMSAEGVGCALMVVNGGEVTASFEDQYFDAGWTVMGRYWDGAFLPQAIWAGLSHTLNNMFNMDSTLNPNPIANAGANCSVPGGCTMVEATFVVISGNQILMVGRQVVSK